MLPAERADYSPIADRRPLKLPGSARVVVWTVVNVEQWDINRSMPRQVLPAPTGASVVPDLPNWAWHEYGMRVGFWRLKTSLDGFEVKPTLSINAAVCQSYPRVAEAARQAGWEFMAHGFDQRPTHQVADEREMIQKTVHAIKEFTGKVPRGWLSPGLTETPQTPDLLAEAGLEYVADWVFDDEPCDLTTQHGRLVSIPYTVECNDLVMIIEHHSAGEFIARCLDTFDRLYAESEQRAKFMAIAVHPYISGAPHRIKHFEMVYQILKIRPGVLFWTGEQILDWYLEARGDQAKE